jgi:HSP20 family protein
MILMATEWHRDCLIIDEAKRLSIILLRRNMSTKAAPASVQSRGYPDLKASYSSRNQLSAIQPPVCDIYETAQNIFITAELPEVRQEDVFVSFENNLLTIGAEHRNAGFRRSFLLPGFVDVKKLSTEFKAGILRVMIGKRDQVLPGKVRVKV